MKFDYKQHKVTEAQFDEMSAVEKRAYILQDHQEETMWWSRTANKLIVISSIIGVILMFWLIANIKK